MTSTKEKIGHLAAVIVRRASEKKILLATAESCTGGMIAAALTEIPGASACFDRGVITYSNIAKQDMLGVPPDLIDRCGAVSGDVAKAMATGAIARSRADIAVSVTGVAGPGGGTAEKPVGLVWFGLARRHGDAEILKRLFTDNGREQIRLSATQTALELLAGAI